MSFLSDFEEGNINLELLDH